MPSRHYRHHAFTTAKSANAAKSAWKVTEKAAVGLARWATTDHTGTVKMLAELTIHESDGRHSRRQLSRSP